MALCEDMFTFNITSRKSSPLSQKKCNLLKNLNGFSISNADGGADRSS